MKKYLTLLVAAAMMIGCTQEPIDTPSNTVIPDEPEEIQTPAEPETPAEPKVVSFSAELPVFEGLTKASVDASDFAWAAGDEIAIPVKDGEGVRYVNFRNSAGALNTFTYSVTDEEFVDGTAYYPATSAPGGSYSTTFSSIAEAQSSFKMTAPVTIGSSSLDFTHVSSIVHLTFTNVPALANKLVVNDGTSDVATINFSQTGDVVFNVPITPAGSSKTYTFKLQENNNVLKQVSKTADLAAGTYYNAKAAVPVGKILRVQDATDWGTKALYIWNNANGEQNAFFSTDGSYPNKFNTISANDHYIVIPSECSWATETTKVGVKFQTADNSSNTQTDGIYPVRDITFNVPAELGMKTEYRIYPHGGSYSTPTARAYHYEAQTVSLLVDCSAISFGTPYLHIGFGANATVWSNKANMTNVGTNLYSYTFPASYYNTSGVVVVSNSKDSDGWKSVDYTPDFTAKKSYTIKLGDGGYGNPATISVTGSTDFTPTEILGDAPGTAFTSPASITGALGTYLSFGTEYYGKSIHVVFSDNGANAKSTWDITLNQDFDYGL